MKNSSYISSDGGPSHSVAGYVLKSAFATKSHRNSDFRPSALVVSANPQHRALLSNLLASDGYQVIDSEDARDALKSVEARSFDLVVTRILMFGMDGLELLQTIGELVPHLPVIVVGDTSPRMNVICLKCASLLGAAETHSYPPDAKLFSRGRSSTKTRCGPSRAEKRGTDI